MSAKPKPSITLAVVCAATAMLMLDIAVVNTALPRMARDLHAGLGGVQWVIGAYTVALAATVLTLGSLADRFGRRRLFTLGLTIFIGASAACGLATTITGLDAARAVQGVGAAAMFASSLALLGDAFPDPARRGKALAAYGATIGASFAVGPLLGGLLTSSLGWRSIFWLNIPLGLLTLLGTATRVAECTALHARRIDVAGQLTLTGGLLLLVTALVRVSANGWTSQGQLELLLAAAALLAAFLIIETLTKEPMLPRGLFRRPDFAAAQIAAFAISASFFAAFIYITLYLQDVSGLSAVEAGAVYLPSSLLMFVVSGSAGPLVNRFGAPRLVVAGLALVALGMLTLTVLPTEGDWLAVLPGTVIAAFGTGLLNPALSAVVLTSTGEQDQALAAGTNDAARQGGIAVGVAFLGTLLPARVLTGHMQTTAFVTGLHHAGLAGATLAAAGTVLIAALFARDDHHRVLDKVPGLPVASKASA